MHSLITVLIGLLIPFDHTAVGEYTPVTPAAPGHDVFVASVVPASKLIETVEEGGTVRVDIDQISSVEIMPASFVNFFNVCERLVIPYERPCVSETYTFVPVGSTAIPKGAYT